MVITYKQIKSLEDGLSIYVFVSVTSNKKKFIPWQTDCGLRLFKATDASPRPDLKQPQSY